MRAAPPTADATTPRRLGRYVLLGTLGRGGMGEVVRARAFGASGATKDLCLKRIHADRLARPGALERFVDEARLSLRLAHGNIVAVFDFGRAGDEHYLVMEWVDGADLRTILGDAEARREPLPSAVAAHVAAEVARALAYAHELGVVHCDVKPANVLVSRTGDVKLTDFGVATAIEAARGGGTRGYVPPEQGAGEKVTPASDLWALGVVLAEMLLGDVPEDPRAGLEAEVAPELAALVGRMLASDPAARPPSAAEVARELEAFVARERGAHPGMAPRDELAARAARLAEARREARAEGTFEASASFARDGERAFTEPTVATASTRQSDPPPRRWTGAARIALAGGAIVALLALLLVRPSQPEISRPMPAPVPAPTSVPVPEPVPVPVPEPVPAAIAPPAEPPQPQPPRRRAPAAPPETLPVTEPATAPAPPAAAEPARLRINAIPWADVSLDGRPLGTTPLFDVEVAPGRHTLRFVNTPLGIERTREVDVASGEQRDLVVDLE